MAEKEKKVPAEEAAEKIEAVVPEEKKEKGEKKPFPTTLVSIIVAAVLVVGVVAFLLVGFISGSNAANNYNANKYEAAYKASTTAFFMDGETKCAIVEAYVENVLCEQGRYVEAAELIEDTKWVSAFKKDGTEITPEERVKSLYEKNGKLAMFKVGSVAEFGEYTGEKISWVVLQVKEEKIGNETHKIAYVMTRDVVDNPMGWGAKNTWEDSNLKTTAEAFYNLFSMKLSAAEKASILETTIAVPEGEAKAKVWVPSVAEIEAMLADEALKGYVLAEPNEHAKSLSVKPSVGDKGTAYYLRDLGKKDGQTQFAAGVNGKGELKDGMVLN